MPLVAFRKNASNWTSLLPQHLPSKAYIVFVSSKISVADPLLTFVRIGNSALLSENTVIKSPNWGLGPFFAAKGFRNGR